MSSATHGSLDTDLVWGHHLLVISPDITEADVEALALSRFAGASRRDEMTIDLIPGAWLTGPWLIDPADRTNLGLPEAAHGAYVVRAPVQRGEPLPEELKGLGGYLEAFADGVPEGSEALVLEFLYAAARRLGGAVRTGGDGAVLVPDPGQMVDLVLYSTTWLEQDRLIEILHSAAPGIAPVPVAGPALIPPAPLPNPDLPEAERARLADLYAAAAEFDAAALSQPEEIRGHGSMCRFDGDDVLFVQAEPVEVVPTVLDSVDFAGRELFSYSLRWYPEHEGGVANDSENRQRAQEFVERCAATLGAEIDAVITDDDGFVVEL